jgi:hypothetical protein
MPYWICGRCQTRLYSAAGKLRRQTCPVCDGEISEVEELAPPIGRTSAPGTRERPRANLHSVRDTN